MLEGLKVAQRGIRDGIKQQQQLVSKAGAPKKMVWSKPEVDQTTFVSRVRAAAESQMAQAINAKDKAGALQRGKGGERAGARQSLTPDFAEQAREIGTELEDIEYRVMRSQVLERGERVDGREIPIPSVPSRSRRSVLPRTHGSVRRGYAFWPRLQGKKTATQAGAALLDARSQSEAGLSPLPIRRFSPGG